jgi:TPP-dependent pyruvate/acetoin dehydrogenase alpha subunit
VVYNQRSISRLDAFGRISGLPRKRNSTFQEKTVTMTGSDRPVSAAAHVSTGGSLISDSKLQAMYTAMLQCRLLTEHANSLRTKPPAYRAAMGQEAIATGWTIALQPEDTVALAPMDASPSLVKGVALQQLVAQLYAVPDDTLPAIHNIIPASSNLEEQFEVITATAFANKRKKKGHVVVSFTNKATTGLASWVEMLTLAAKRKLPIVFAIENNPWAAPARESDTDDFSQKARGYGLTGISVDGNDVVAVYRVAFESLERVRKGDGPVMIEGKTYHESGAGKRSRAVERDPLIHMERYLKAKKLFKTKRKEQLVEEFTQELKRAAKAARKASR